MKNRSLMLVGVFPVSLRVSLPSFVFTASFPPWLFSCTFLRLYPRHFHASTLCLHSCFPFVISRFSCFVFRIEVDNALVSIGQNPVVAVPNPATGVAANYIGKFQNI